MKIPRCLIVGFFHGDLGKDHGNKNQNTAGDLVFVHAFLQEQPAAEYRKNRFQTHDQGSGSGLHVLLSDDLQRIRHTAVKPEKGFKIQNRGYL